MNNISETVECVKFNLTKGETIIVSYYVIPPDDAPPGSDWKSFFKTETLIYQEQDHLALIGKGVSTATQDWVHRIEKQIIFKIIRRPKHITLEEEMEREREKLNMIKSIKSFLSNEQTYEFVHAIYLKCFEEKKLPIPTTRFKPYIEEIIYEK